ncbi:hypothetical protein BJ085DRAFT_30090 [Dimargaris cristalligena]|uniref:Uncharacterized protein n=1 Tax=Dimargaris cristalligena TaxID=215637 RepID=A0A4P9ZTK9_9FUNG|nr:hypothetical protein BJ085DRAFT_30090 [Dimargaris cristalligena]|eukprot:RKP36815.1 hypothetical protein BJ085DRAFT_30090 [Dimargaris cristalligena]
MNILQANCSVKDWDRLKKFFEKRKKSQKTALFFDYIMGATSNNDLTSTDGTVELKDSTLAQLARKEPKVDQFDDNPNGTSNEKPGGVFDALFNTVFKELKILVSSRMAKLQRELGTSGTFNEDTSQPPEVHSLEQAWRTQINVVTKVLAVRGRTKLLESVLKPSVLKYLSVDNLTTSALWAIKFNHSETATLLYTRAGEISREPNKFQEILEGIKEWTSAPSGNRRAYLHESVVRELLDEFASPVFTDYFDSMADFSDSFDDSQEDVLKIMANKPRFKNVV